jgi:hypothetical protein
MKTIRVPAVLVAILSGGLAAHPTAAAERSLEAILAAPEAPRAIVDLPGQPIGALLADAAGFDRWPVTCASPFTLALEQRTGALAPHLERARRRVAVPPDLFGERTLVNGRDGFAIHYGSAARGAGLMGFDRDLNGHADFADRVAEALAAARSLLVDRLGYPDPAAVTGTLAVYLDIVDGGVEGLTAWPAAGHQAGPAPFLLIDSRLANERIAVVAAHQYAHASLALLDPRAAPWWTEATAAWLAFAVTGDLAGLDTAVRDRLLAPGRGLDSDDLVLMQGALIWPMFLAEMTGDPGIVRQAWGDAAGHGLSPLAAVDAALRRTTALPLAAALREFAVWNLFTGSRDDGRHYAVGRSLPEAALPTIGPDPPLSIGPLEPIDAGGSVAFRIAGDARRGSLDFEISGEGGHPGADLLVWIRGEIAGPALVGLPIAAGTPGRASIPWSEVREAWLVLRNDGDETTGRTHLAAGGSLDVTAPFDLAALTAQAAGRSIRVEWTTASESGLAGWNIYRSDSPAGPFARLNAVLIPAFGDSRDEIGYLFQDEPAPPGRRLYYQVEGITTLGFADRSFVVSARTAPAR